MQPPLPRLQGVSPGKCFLSLRLPAPPSRALASATAASPSVNSNRMPNSANLEAMDEKLLGLSSTCRFPKDVRQGLGLIGAFALIAPLGMRMATMRAFLITRADRVAKRGAAATCADACARVAMHACLCDNVCFATQYTHTTKKHTILPTCLSACR